MSEIKNMSAASGRRLGENENVVNEADIMQAQIGGYGAHFISDTVAHTPAEGYVFVAVQVIADAVLSTCVPAYAGNTFTGVTLPAGVVVYGRFTSIALASGKVLAYQGV